MKKLKTLFVIALVSLMSLAIVTEDATARGGRSSSGRSSYRAPARTKSAPRVKKTAPRKVSPTKAAPAKKSTWGGKKAIAPKTGRATAKPKMSAAKAKSLETAKKNGTSFKSKDAATAAFKKNQAGKYPSKYASKPATRPEHIPATTMVGGRSVTVVYNADRGCYGYPGSTLGAFIAYDMMADAVMRNRYMASSHYIVHNPVVYQRPVIVRSGPGIGTILLWTIIIVGCIVVVVVVGNKVSGKNQSRG